MPGVFFKALNDRAAVPVDIKGTGSGVVAGLFPDRHRDDVCCGCAASFSEIFGRFHGGGLFVIINALYFPADWRISLQEYQRQRLLVYFDKDFAPPNATPVERKAARELQRERTHNIRQAEISVGSGGLTERGGDRGRKPGWDTSRGAWPTTTSSSPSSRRRLGFWAA